MKLSTFAIEAMGFQPLPPGGLIAGVFHSAHVYEVQGFIIDTGALDTHAGHVDRTPYRLCVGSSVNEVCRKLFGENLIEVEGDWQKERKCTPPYLVILLGPTQEHQGVGTHFRTLGQTITTYDSFPKARSELKEQENLVLPPLMSALACSFASSDAHIKFVPVDRVLFGRTAGGSTIFDMRVTASGSGYVSHRFEESAVQIRVADALRLAGEMNANVARLYHLALNEDDELKRFCTFSWP